MFPKLTSIPRAPPHLACCYGDVTSDNRGSRDDAPCRISPDWISIMLLWHIIGSKLLCHFRSPLIYKLSYSSRTDQMGNRRRYLKNSPMRSLISLLLQMRIDGETRWSLLLLRCSSWEKQHNHLMKLSQKGSNWDCKGKLAIKSATFTPQVKILE